MKSINYIIFIIVLLNTALAQSNDISILETDVAKIEAQLEQLSSSREQINQQIGELAKKISALKNKSELSYFERQRLESYLKNSQKLSSQADELDLNIHSAETNLQTHRRQLINRYEEKIKHILLQFDQAAMAESQKIDLATELAGVKNKRELTQAKIDLQLYNPSDFLAIDIDPSERDDARRLTQKADLLKDQEEKLRQNAKSIEGIVSNLKEEIEIRDKMSELSQELSLFSPQDETMNQTRTHIAQAGSDKEAGAGVTENDDRNFYNNAFLDDASNSKSSLLLHFPNLINPKEIPNLSNSDIQSIIRQLQNRKKYISAVADSIDIKAKKIYQQAEQARQIKR
jgi:hypothetical protein